ncbi:MAG: DNA-3-methyladenine glycosylase I [Candidatus Thiodiazotropha sp. (ex Monitilora ramsayi)]|nr:DNA-3-methyladenine glycosylase I [Candidatus Thiodiazotropha sp. (ex Monitilora ramsayi)]
MSTDKRCTWAGDDPLYLDYHDTEWGVPCFDDRQLFEFLILEGAQAGLAWITILRKRGNYRQSFDEFDPVKIARYSQKRVDKLLQNPGIVRNRLKVESTVSNAKAYLEIQEKHGSFSDYLWRYVDGKPITNHWRDIKQVPASTPLSDQLSKDLKKAGFRFVGTTICYAYMQAVGLVNDHTTDCFRHSHIAQLNHG